jgi:hypothetical protein
MRMRLIDSPLDFPGQPCAMRERLPSAARRVRASPHFVYREPITSVNAQSESPPVATVFNRCREANVVGSTRSSPAELQISPATPNWRVHCRLRLHQARVGDRTRRRSACGKRRGCAPYGLPRKSGLAGDPLLEQRSPQQHQRSSRGNSAGPSRPVAPHPPSASRWAPPSPALRERGCCAGL